MDSDGRVNMGSGWYNGRYYTEIRVAPGTSLEGVTFGAKDEEDDDDEMPTTVVATNVVFAKGKKDEKSNDALIPTCHYAMHLPMQPNAAQCSHAPVHERKHQDFKRVGAAVPDASSNRYQEQPSPTQVAAMMSKIVKMGWDTKGEE